MDNVLIIESEVNLSKASRDAEEKRIKDITGKNVVILPEGLKVAKEPKNKFEIWGKDRFIQERIDTLRTKEDIDRAWEKASKGYNFVIATNNNEIYSVPYFNERLEE